MVTPLYQSLNSKQIERKISEVKRYAYYAAPGIRQAPATAFQQLAQRIGSDQIKVCLDFDERVFRLGFGDLSAVKTLRDARIDVHSMPGLRTGILIFDDEGFIFTPTALYLETEADPDSEDAPNAMRLSKNQVTETLARFSPASKEIAIHFASNADEKDKIKAQNPDVISKKLADHEIETVDKKLKDVPPLQFDIARQVRVYTSYLQYVNLKLSGAAIQRSRLAILTSILRIGGSKDLDNRLKTTFDLIERGSKLSSKELEDDLKKIRKDFTPSLGKNHPHRVLLKSAKPLFKCRIKEIEDKLKCHQKRIKEELQKGLENSKNQIINYYIDRVLKSPPDSLLGGISHPEPTQNHARKWLESELENVFPSAENIIKNMKLEIHYSDVTIETLRDENFLKDVKDAFPFADWEKVHEEFRAAGESKHTASEPSSGRGTKEPGQLRFLVNYRPG